MLCNSFFSQICCNAINNAVDTIILLNYLYNFYNHKFGYNGNVKSLSGQQKERLNIRNGFFTLCHYKTCSYLRIAI